jgi:Protein of unknown function (DUF2752)
MRKALEWFIFVILILGPLVLLCLPADYFDNGRELCPSKLFFKIECWGCGITRSIQHLIHFDFDSAIYYHRGVWLIFPFLLYVWFDLVKNAAHDVGLLKVKK